jgi:hypothetical protein
MRRAVGTFALVVAAVLCLFGWLADETWNARRHAIIRIQHQLGHDAQEGH